eukprot:gene7031-7820_t
MSRRRKSAFTPPSPKLIQHAFSSHNRREKQLTIPASRKTIYKSKSLPDNLQNISKKRINSNSNITQEDILFNKLKNSSTAMFRAKSVSFQPEIMLLNAVSEDDYKEIERLLKMKNIDINYKTASGQNVLHHAAYTGSIGCIKLLIENGVDINVLDNMGRSALDIAVRNGFLDCAAELIQNGSKVEQLVIGGDHW